MITKWLRVHWRLVLNWATLIALVVLVYAIRHQLGDTIHNLTKVNAWALLLLLPVEALNYHAQAKLYQGLFSVVGDELDYRFMYRASLELNFVNHVFPSGGLTGFSYFSARLKSGKQLSASKSTLIQFMKLGLTFLSFELLMVFGLISLAVMGRVNDLTILVAAVLSTLIVVVTCLFIYIVGSRQRINSLFTFLSRIFNRIARSTWSSNSETINIERVKEIFNEFHDNYQTIKGSLGRLRKPFWYSLLANVTEIGAVYVVYIAFGKLVNVGAVILGYGVANFAGFVSVLPGGIGIYEALMTAVLATTGIRAAVSLPVTVMYRVLNTLIQLPPGYYLYQRALRGGAKLPGAPDAT